MAGDTEPAKQKVGEGRGGGMKFCYIDESGKGSEPVLVVAGIIADASRMHVTKREWMKIIDILAGIVGKPVSEFHTRRFYKGNGIWRDLNGEQRSQIMDAILNWLGERKHKVVFSAVDKAVADTADFTDKPELQKVGGRANYWLIATLHLMLSVQKLHQSERKNKGNTVLIFDRGVDENALAKLSMGPPCWSDGFYSYRETTGEGKRKKPNPEMRLNQIVDVPYFGDSKHVGLLQIADLFAYLLRHYAELVAGATQDKYQGETDKVRGWVAQIAALAAEDSMRWPTRNPCACAEWFSSVAPDALKRICREFADGKKSK